MPDSPPSHSAGTTLLIDDSAKKAFLQPYNHICVPEYTGDLRNRDLRTIDMAQPAQTEEQTPQVRVDILLRYVIMDILIL